MPEIRTCTNVGGECPAPASFRYTWPGRDEAVACVVHANALLKIANAMGMHLRVIPLEPEERVTP